jgi:hypothetical protein
MRLVFSGCRAAIVVVVAFTAALCVFERPVWAQAAAGVPNVAGDEPKVAAEKLAEKLYAAAIEAEAAGDGPTRNKLLRQATQAMSGFAPARWRLGEIRDDGKWRSVDDAAERWAADARLAEYQRRRNDMRDNLGGNLTLARWASKSALTDEAEVHWRRVFAARPGHEEAAKALALKRLNGRWLEHHDYVVAAESVREANRAAELWKPRISSIRRDLSSPDEATRARGLADLHAITDRQAIATLQEAFSLADPRDPFRPVDEKSSRYERDMAWNLEYVKLLGTWPEIEATKALVREAVISPLEEVRNAAADQLAKRPLHHFVPRLLAGLVSPIDAHVTLAVGFSGGVYYRRTFFQEGLLADTVRTFDAYYENVVNKAAFDSSGLLRIVGVEEPVPKAKMKSLAADAAEINAAVERFNAASKRLNARIAAVAYRATGADLPGEPSPWWRWWQDYNELYVPETKPIDEKWYVTDYAPPAIGGSEYDLYASSRSTSCFVAGTPVMTKTGPQPIDAIRIGDMVLAQNVETGELAFKAVAHRTVRPAAPILAIGLGSETIRLTRGHPLWVAGENWQMAKFLRPGDRLHSIAGPAPITSIEDAPAEATYNLVVADWHNYFVGDRRVLVHDNAPQQPTVMRLPGVK